MNTLNGPENKAASEPGEKATFSLKEEHIKFEILSKAINDAIWDWNMQDGSLTWNHGLFSIYGYDPQKVPHHQETWKDNIHPDDKDELLNGLAETFAKKNQNWNGLYRYRCLNGNYKYTYDRGFVVYEDDRPVRMIGAMQDIDERMIALREIEKLSLVASNTDNLVVITDADEKIEWVNQAFVKRTGYPLHEVIGQTPRFLHGPETDPDTVSRIQDCLKKQVPVTEEILNYARDGTRFWLRMNINPVFDAAQKLVKFVAVETDVTLQKEYERKITAIATDLTNLIATANAPVFGVDRNGYINEWNYRAVEVTGFSQHEVLHENLVEKLVDENFRTIMAEKIKKVYSGEPFSNLEVPVITKANNRIVILLNATPRKNSNEEVESLFLVGQDITEITQYRHSLEEKVKERTEELRAALEKEKELVSIKSRFASIVSHEFRTPLSTISLSASHIRKFRTRLQPEDIDKKLDIIQQQVMHMSDLLEDVITIGKTESGKIEITKKEINIDRLIMAIKEDVENQFKNTHTIHCNFDLLREDIISDEGLLRNILVNLMSNAIKFSPDQSDIHLTAREVPGFVEINVKDSGIGIPPKDQERIFSPFDRGTNVSTIQGTGLGLSIAKKASDLIGGAIVVESEVGKGSVFTVKIPVQ